MHLNEQEKSMEGVIPPTDSRLRPDIRAMENGDIGDLDLSPYYAAPALNTISGGVQFSLSVPF